jgi:hypothetical protein
MKGNCSNLDGGLEKTGVFLCFLFQHNIQNPFELTTGVKIWHDGVSDLQRSGYTQRLIPVRWLTATI